MDNRWCVYLHYLPGQTEPFYVGIGVRNRPYQKAKRSMFWKRVVRDSDIVVEIVKNNLTKEQATELEISLIKKWGKRCNNTGCLVNITDGGEGMLGYKHSPEALEKIRQAVLNRSPETLEKIRQATLGRGLGKQRPSWVRDKISLSRINRESGLSKVHMIHESGKKDIVTNRSEFARTHGLNLRKLYAVISGERRTHKGWRLDDTRTD